LKKSCCDKVVIELWWVALKWDWIYGELHILQLMQLVWYHSWVLKYNELQMVVAIQKLSYKPGYKLTPFFFIIFVFTLYGIESSLTKNGFALLTLRKLWIFCLFYRNYPPPKTISYIFFKILLLEGDTSKKM